MSEYLEQAIRQARQWDAARARSQQTELGWSEMAACRSYMGFVIRGEWATEDEENWRAIAGTGLHAWLTHVRMDAHYKAGGQAAFEVEVEYGGVPGHADEVTWQPEFAVTDYKFPSKSSARLYEDPDVLEEKFIQVQGYAAGVLESAPEVFGEPVVRLLVCPVDGTFDDWRVYERPFDREAADLALVRYAYVQQAVAGGEELPKDKPFRWCERYCEFFSACRDPEDRERMAEITDPEMAAAVEAYGEAREARTAADKVMDDMAPVIKGLYGTARGWKIRMSRAGSGRLEPDTEAMLRHYSDEDLSPPMRKVSGQPAKLLVSREKS
jgi:hypothetical protein